MRTRLLRCLAAVLLVLSLSLPFAAGQGDLKVDRGVSGGPATAESDKDSSAPSALPHVALALYTLLVLTIVFMPSRQA